MHFQIRDPRGTRNCPFRPQRFSVEPADAPYPVSLLFSCQTDCFAPALLDRQLTPRSRWIHRTAGTLVPPYGTGHAFEDELIEKAVTVWKVREIIVCGHWPCGVLTQLLQSDAPASDLVGERWLAHAAVIRRLAADLPAGADRLRLAAERSIQLQLRNLHTHPAVAVALERANFRLLAWLHDDHTGELFFASTARGRFDRRAALHPDHNGSLRTEQVHRCRSTSPPSMVDAHHLYLA